MKYLLLGSLVLALWIAFELWRAPHLDDKGNVIKPTKKNKRPL